MGGLPFTRRRVQDTLTNPFYAGLVVRNRSSSSPPTETARGRHPALVPIEDFETLQRNRAGRDRAAGSDRRPGRPHSRHLLATLAVCGRCQAIMRPRISSYRRVDGSQARSYACRNVVDGTGLCDFPTVDAEAIDALVLRHLDRFVLDSDAWLQARAELRDARRSARETRTAALTDRLRALQRRESRLVDDYARQVADGKELRAELAARALADDREQAKHLQDQLRGLQESGARRDDAEDDAMLDLYNELSRALSGVLGRDRPLVEVNTELHRYFEAFSIDRLEDGRIVVVPIVAPSTTEAVWELFAAGDWDTLDGSFPDARPLVVGGPRRLHQRDDDWWRAR